jgi:hypothetical protein
MLSAGWHSLNWGDVPTWVGSVLTGVALLIAAITYRKSIRESAREQAKSITVWVGEQAADLSYELQIKNGSNSAIYSAAVYYSRQVLVAPTYNSPYYLAEHNAGGLIRIGDGRQSDLVNLVRRLSSVPYLTQRSPGSTSGTRTA